MWDSTSWFTGGVAKFDRRSVSHFLSIASLTPNNESRNRNKHAKILIGHTLLFQHKLCFIEKKNPNQHISAQIFVTCIEFIGAVCLLMPSCCTFIMHVTLATACYMTQSGFKGLWSLMKHISLRVGMHTKLLTHECGRRVSPSPWQQQWVYREVFDMHPGWAGLLLWAGNEGRGPRSAPGYDPMVLP